MQARWFLWGAAVVVAGTLGVTSVGAAEDDEVREELERLKARLSALEERDGDRASSHDESAGHRPHPLHSLAKTTLDGDLTMIGQTTPSVAPGAQSEGTMSVDLFFEHQVSAAGLVLLHLDVAQGQGFQFFPVFIAPNGNPTGSNNDIETFDGEAAVHLAQAYYHHHWFNQRIELTVGQYDPTAFFDTNAYANSERTQFVSPAFGTNPTFEFGGTSNFYGVGGVLEIRPADRVTVILGVMEGDGDYREMFTRPWSAVEADFELDLWKRDGTYRFLVWDNHRHHDPASSLQPDVPNRGFGINFDQALTDQIGVWGRYGVQDGAVAYFDRAVSVGVQLKGGVIDRPFDAFGVGYGLTMISDAYAAYQASLGNPQFDTNEGYLEAYYRCVLSGDGERIGVAVSPDVQYITNAGGDRSIDPIVVYGVRFQAFF